MGASRVRRAARLIASPPWYSTPSGVTKWKDRRTSSGLSDSRRPLPGRSANGMVMTSVLAMPVSRLTEAAQKAQSSS